MAIAHVHHKFQSIELLRFLAAMAVVCVHIPTIGVGNFGVDIFFAISGFVMMLSTEKSAEKFFLKRIIRIAPTYYFFTFAVFAIALVMPTMLNGTSANGEHLAKSLLFIPFDKNGTGHFPILFLDWTLNYEMFFYAIFAVSLFISHKYRALSCALLLLCIFYLCKDIMALPLKAYGDAIIFEFVLGMALYEASMKKNFRSALALFMIIVIALLMTKNIWDQRLLLYGFPAVIFVWFTMAVLRGKNLPAFVTILGGASYALYLTHPYIIQFFDKVTHWFSGNMAMQSLALILTLLLVNIAACIIYIYAEQPIQKFLRAKFIADKNTMTTTFPSKSSETL